MVRVDAGGGSFCIDATEATNAEYALFLAAVAVEPVAGHPACGYDSEYTPWWAWPPSSGKDAFPVRNVDFCDAAAYCAWTGKRLCRAVGGGSLSWTKWTLDGPDFPPLDSEWAIACSSIGKYKFTYGNEPSSTKCQNTTLGDDGPVAVASMAGCHSPDGPLASVFDLSGNLAEWEDGCDSAFGKDDNCLIRGGSYRDLPEEQTCLVADFRPRANQDFILGIRCCSDPH